MPGSCCSSFNSGGPIRGFLVGPAHPKVGRAEAKIVRSPKLSTEFTQTVSEVERIGNMNDNARCSDGIDPFSILIMKCAVAARSAGARDFDAAKELLETLLSAWALTDCPAFFHWDSSQPGFVSALVRDKTVHVPIHLAPLFPQKNLEALVDRAEEVRAMTDSTICLSGSHVFGISSAVDTDYCEYVLHTGRRLAGSFAKLASLRSSICATVRHGGNKLAGPLMLTTVTTLCRTDSGRVGGVCNCQPRRDWKFEYFCLTPTAPTIVTNLCVHEEDCEEFSWAYQEAAITAAGQPLRQLVDPLQLARYVDWLRKTIEDYKMDKLLKGLKRALSLCRILSLEQSSSSIWVLLNSPVAVQVAKNEAERDVAKLREHLPPQEQNKISAPALESGDNVSEDGFRVEANSMLSSVIEQYDNLMQYAESLVDAERSRS